MSLDNTVALITLDEFKRMSGYSTDKEYTAEILALIESLINSASRFIEQYCNRKFISGTITSEIRNGNGTSKLRTKQAPLRATISTIYYWDGTAWAAETGTVFTQDNNTGELYYTDSNIFTEGFKNYKIGYTYGYVQTSIPADLKYACFEIVSYWKRISEEKLFGTTSLSFGDQSVNYNLGTISPNIRIILNNYVRRVPD